jgi:hypothetical protein
LVDPPGGQLQIRHAPTGARHSRPRRGGGLFVVLVCLLCAAGGGYLYWRGRRERRVLPGSGTGSSRG